VCHKFEHAGTMHFTTQYVFGFRMELKGNAYYHIQHNGISFITKTQRVYSTVRVVSLGVT